MPEDVKRGSNGGNARAAKLTKEQRSAIAKAAAAKRWGKKEETITGITILNGGPVTLHTITTVPAQHEPVTGTVQPDPIPAPPPVKPPVKRKKPMVKEFGRALSYAEKRLADAMRERAEAMGKVAMLNAEIPSLVQVVKALGGTVNPQVANMAPQYPMQPGDVYQFNGHAGTVPMPPPMPDFNIPQVPLIPGAAVGGAMELDYTPKDEGRLPTMAGDWR